MLSDFSYKFNHYQMNKTQEQVYGEEILSPEYIGAYWGYILYQKVGNESVNTAETLIVEGEIHIHCYPEIEVNDILRYNLTGEVFQVIGVYLGNDETICNVRKIGKDNSPTLSAFSRGFKQDAVT